jgi:hypothetical protein
MVYWETLSAFSISQDCFQKGMPRSDPMGHECHTRHLSESKNGHCISSDGHHRFSRTGKRSISNIFLLNLNIFGKATVRPIFL